jgi:acyl transferase domain-containing protein
MSYLSKIENRKSTIQLLLLSAKTGSALDKATANLAQHFKQHPEINLADAAFTLQVGRKAFSHRRMVVCQNVDDAARALESPGSQEVLSGVHEAGERPVLFMFSGQGSQYVNMALELYETQPIFRDSLDRCDEILRPHLETPLLEIPYPKSGQSEIRNPKSEINQTAYTQPALFALEYALAKLWMAWGIEPTAMIGHSIGEYAAACLAGVFSLEDAISLVAVRGKMMQQLPSGSMLAVPLSEKDLVPLLDEDLSLAAINGPTRCVVSGSSEKIEQFQQSLDRQGIQGIPLRTSHAFHSAMMEPVLEAFRERVSQVSLHPPQIPYISHIGHDICARLSGFPTVCNRFCTTPLTSCSRLVPDEHYPRLPCGTGTNRQVMLLSIQSVRPKTPNPIMRFC